MDTTERVSKFIVQTSSEDIPEDAYRIAKTAFIDVIGVSLAGSTTPAGRIVIDLAPKNGKATVLGTQTRSIAREAALCNGVMAHALDLDDFVWSGFGHPSSVIAPALLALGEEHCLSGRELLLSYVVGFEIAVKTGRALLQRLYDKQWHPTAVLGSIAAAAAAAKLLKLDDDKTRMTLGIAASLAGGLRENFGSMTKPFHAGSAARNGTLAAQLAKKGFTASRSALEAPQGFFKAFFDTGYNLDLVSRDLGKPFEIVTSGINFKPYPSCGSTHRCINAMLDIVHSHTIAPEEVVEIQCMTSKTLRVPLIHSHPTTGLEGKFSLEYCMAVALLDGKVGLKQFSDKRVADSLVQDLMTKVKWIHPEEMDTLEGRFSLPEKVTVKLVSGKSYSDSVLQSKGTFDNPLTSAELLAKYRECASLVLKSSQIETSIQRLMEMESCKDINEITRELVAS